eukprot:6212729-Ditylum_brightwellii.AAC.1
MSYYGLLHHCCYVILYNNVQSLCEGKDGKFIYQKVKDKEEDTSVSSKVVCSNDNERNNVFLFCAKQRNAIDADPASKIVIGTAWTHKHFRCTARAFGGVFFVDATEETNNKEMPLRTVSVCASLMKQ